jgi:hypothetical protein
VSPHLIKKYDYALVFKLLINELLVLEKFGISVTYEGKSIILKGTISFIVADSLGANGIGGYIESFGPNVKGKFCRFCNCDNENDIQTKFRDKDFPPRTIESRKKDLELLAMTKNLHINGVKKADIFESLKYFSCTDGQPPDFAHDFLEGVCGCNFSLLFFELQESGIYSVLKLNESLRTFKYGRIDGLNKVVDKLLSNNSVDNISGFRMTACHMWTLMCIFPLIAGELLKDNPFYLHFVSLIEIFRFLLADDYDEIKILELESRIYYYLLEFIERYPKQRITAKLHFMSHYGRAIRNFGSPLSYMSLRFESKHGYFKRVNNAVHNYINMTKSMADRHQSLQVFHLMQETLFKGLTLGSKQEINNATADYITILLANNNTSAPNNKIFKWIEYRGLRYQQNDLVAVKSQEIKPAFGKILFVVYNNNIIYLYIERLITKAYVDYLCGYELEETEQPCRLVTLEELQHHHPLDLYIYELDRLVVIPRYPIN